MTDFAYARDIVDLIQILLLAIFSVPVALAMTVIYSTRDEECLSFCGDAGYCTTVPRKFGLGLELARDLGVFGLTYSGANANLNKRFSELVRNNSFDEPRIGSGEV